MRRERCAMEALEVRALLSGNALGIGLDVTGAGQILKLTGTPGPDQIVVSRLEGRLAVTNGDWNAAFGQRFSGIIIHAGKGNDRVSIDSSADLPTTLYGDAGNDTLLGGDCDDFLFGGAGIDRLEGGAGNDTLSDVGGSRLDRMSGGDGTDSFWLGSSNAEKIVDLTLSEKKAGGVHRIASFFSGGSGVKRSTRAGRIADPLRQKPNNPAAGQGVQYRGFAWAQLFSSNGPSQDDVRQGGVGDCYLLAGLAAIAKANPEAIRQSISELGDGTYAVRFYRRNVATYIRVDATLPVAASGALPYAKLGKQGALWVALMEKAYAVFRSKGGSYAALSGGFVEEANAALGLSDKTINRFANGTQMMKWIDGQLETGHSVALGTLNPSGAPLLARHAYSVDSVIRRGGRITGIRIRNPWGVDGVRNASRDDGYITLSPAQAMASMWMVVSATA